MATDIEICNKALRSIGEDRITALSDATEPARLCTDLYPFARDAVLREHPWRCAVTRAQLSQMAATPAFGFDYQYQIPTDCLRVLGVYDSSGAEITDATSWAKEAYNDGTRTRQVIVTDETALYAKYIRRETDTEQFDPLLVEALSARLAAELAERLPKANTVTDMAWKLYVNKLAAAKFVDATEAAQPEAWTSTWESSKF